MLEVTRGHGNLGSGLRTNIICSTHVDRYGLKGGVKDGEGW